MSQVRWTVSVETFEGLTQAAHTLERFGDALDADDRVLGPAASLDSGRGVLSATFQVEARSQGAAADLGIDVFYGALAAAGFDVEKPGWRLKLEIEPVDQIPAPA
jgi:hypothetical protein